MSEAKDVLERKKRRESDLETITPDDFYHCTLDGDINVIISQRSDGKSYDRLAHCLKQYKEHKYRFVYIRRWAEDITIKNMSKLMDPFLVNKYVKVPLIEELFGPDRTIRCNRGMFELIDETGEEPPEPIGYYVALNQVAHTKSVPFTNVKNIILDEFLQLKSERILKDEFDAYEQTLSSIIRADDDVKIWLLGNTVGKYSPYFAPLGIDVANLVQGEIKKIELPNGEGMAPTRVEVEWCKYNPKIGKKTSKYVRGSKMAVTGEWEIQSVENIPHTDNEKATEKLLFSMWDYVMGINLGVFLRTSIWFTGTTEDYKLKQIPHKRQFLVIRQTNKQSSFYHLTNVKDLKYNTWTNLNDMFKDIKDRCFIDVLNELKHNRVFSSDAFTADYFYHTYLNYTNMGLRDLL